MFNADQRCAVYRGDACTSTAQCTNVRPPPASLPMSLSAALTATLAAPRRCASDAATYRAVVGASADYRQAASM